MPLSAIFKLLGVGGDLEGGGPLDLLGDDELPQALGEVHHPFFLADPDRVAQLDVFLVEDQLADGRVRSA